MLDGDEIVFHLVRDFLCAAERFVDCARYIIFIGFPSGARHTRELAQLLQNGCVQTLDRDPHLPE